MAAASGLVGWLAYSGAKNSDNTPVGSGKVYFYVPGSVSTQVTAYSDRDCTAAITQPLVLDAAGRGSAWLKVRARIEVQSSLGVVVLVQDTGNTVSAGQVEVDNTGFTATTLSGVLDSIATSTGTGDGSYKENTGTARTLKSAVGWKVEPQDHGALGDDANDDTSAIQAAIARALVTGKPLYIGPGTYRISSALTATGGSSKGLVIRGSGRDDCIIKQTSVTANGLTIDLSSAIDSKISIEGVTWTCSTTSSGAAIMLTNGNKVTIKDCEFLLYRTAIDGSAVSGTTVERCIVTSNDGNAAVMGINVGAKGRVMSCDVTSGTVTGTGIKLSGADARARDSHTTNFVTAFSVTGANCNLEGCTATTPTTGISFTGAGGTANGCTVTTCTTGVSLAAANCIANACRVTTATTGFSLAAAGCLANANLLTTCTTGVSVGAFASCTVTNNYASGGTTDLSVNASATLFLQHGNTFSVVTDSSSTTRFLPRKYKIAALVSSASQLATFTPDITLGNVQRFRVTYAAGTAQPTIANHATSTLSYGDEMIVIIEKTGANNISGTTWGTQYKIADASTALTNWASVVTSGFGITVYLFWNGTQWICTGHISGTTMASF